MPSQMRSTPSSPSIARPMSITNTNARFQIAGISMFSWPPMAAYFGRDAAGVLHTAIMNPDGTPDEATLVAVEGIAPNPERAVSLIQVQAYLDTVDADPATTYPVNARTIINIFDRPSGNVLGILTTFGVLTKPGTSGKRDTKLAHVTLQTDAVPTVDITLPKSLTCEELIQAAAQLKLFAQQVQKHHAAPVPGYSEIIHHS